jgi:hypothetical protein
VLWTVYLSLCFSQCGRNVRQPVHVSDAQGSRHYIGSAPCFSLVRAGSDAHLGWADQSNHVIQAGAHTCGVALMCLCIAYAWAPSLSYLAPQLLTSHEHLAAALAWTLQTSGSSGGCSRPQWSSTWPAYGSGKTRQQGSLSGCRQGRPATTCPARLISAQNPPGVSGQAAQVPAAQAAAMIMARRQHLTGSVTLWRRVASSQQGRGTKPGKASMVVRAARVGAAQHSTRQPVIEPATEAEASSSGQGTSTFLPLPAATTGRAPGVLQRRCRGQRQILTQQAHCRDSSLHQPMLAQGMSRTCTALSGGSSVLGQHPAHPPLIFH